MSRSRAWTGVPRIQRLPRQTRAAWLLRLSMQLILCATWLGCKADASSSPPAPPSESVTASAPNQPVRTDSPAESNAPAREGGEHNGADGSKTQVRMLAAEGAQVTASASVESRPPTSAELPQSASPSAGTKTPATGSDELSKEVRVEFKTVPPVWANVRMGSKRLGVIKGRDSLVIQRPRDSGPLDVVIRAAGYLPVHTRAYTFEDSVVDVKMTKAEEKHTLYGFKEPLPPQDAGVSPF